MESKKLSLALRINSDLPTKVKVNVKNALGEIIEYDLLSMPFYFCHQVYRLLNQMMQ